MTLFLIGLLCFSITGLVGLIALKRWETASGRVLFSGVRPAAGHYLGAGLHFAERRVPALLKGFGWTLYRKVRAALHLFVAWSVVHTERLLELVLQTLRHTTTTKGTGEASAFLREVAEHKKSLINRSSKKKNAIYEE